MMRCNYSGAWPVRVRLPYILFRPGRWCHRASLFRGVWV